MLWNQGKIQTLISTNSSGVVVGSFVRNGQRYNADGTPVVDLASTGAIPSVIDPNTITQVSFPVDNQADAQVATTINTTDADYALCNPGSGSTWSDLLPITVNYYLPTGGVSDVISQLQAQGYTVNLTQDSVYAYKDDGSYIYTDASSIEVGGGSIPNLKFDKNALQVTRTQQQADGVFLVDTFAIDPTNPSISTQISTGTLTYTGVYDASTQVTQYTDGRTTTINTYEDGSQLQRIETKPIANGALTQTYNATNTLLKTESVITTQVNGIVTTQTTTTIPNQGTTIVTQGSNGTFDVKGYDSFNALVSTSHTDRVITSSGLLADQTVEKQYDVTTGRIVNTVSSFHLLLDPQIRINVTGDFAGGTININYTLDENKQIVGVHVVSINGSAPLNNAEVDRFFKDNNIDPNVITADGDFSGSANPAAYAQYLALKQFLAEHDGSAVVKPVPPPSTAVQTITNALQTTQDVLQFIQAIQQGKPLPIVASGLRLATQVNTDLHAINGTPISTNLAGAADVASGVLSVLSFSNALKMEML